MQTLTPDLLISRLSYVYQPGGRRGAEDAAKPLTELKFGELILVTFPVLDVSVISLS